MAPTRSFDPRDPEFRTDPHRFFARLRREDPLHWNPHLKAYALTRHRDVFQVLRHPHFLATPMRANTATLLRRSGRSLPTLDRLIEAAVLFDSTPGHREARRMLVATLNMRPLGEYAPLMADVTDRLIDALRGRPSFDAVSDFADPLPVHVIHRVLGIPEELFDTLRAATWGLDGLFNYVKAIRELVAWDAQCRTGFAVIDDLVRQRRAAPREDGITRMIALAAQDGIDHERLVARIFFLIMVASDTTSATIGNAIALALATPGIVDAITDPATTAAAVEELLRLEGTALFAARYADRDTELAGLAVPEGTVAYCYLAAANRDPEAYPDPDRFVAGRGGPPHFAFGDGIHACIGASFARLEARIALHAFFTRLGPLRRVEAGTSWLPLDAFRHLARLPVAVD
ncbi:MAG: cytochrome P450 [Alphaproteobacteria bacterium]|nr:cytochrome P450 [Alphaproteobacteria bacterium]